MSARTIISYADLRQAERDCAPVEQVTTNVSFLLALRKGSDSRDDFAKAAMQGICAHPDTWGLGNAEIAAMAYDIADAMLAARSAS